MKKLIQMLIFLFSCLTASGSLFAQSTGSISGVVVDSADSVPLAGIVVKIKGTAIGAETDQEGQFVILLLTPRTYTLTATGFGYEPGKIRGIHVLADKRTKVNFNMVSSTNLIYRDLELEPTQRGPDPYVSGWIITRDWIEQTGRR